jgi:SOS-response transcriptional repressor LexA
MKIKCNLCNKTKDFEVSLTRKQKKVLSFIISYRKENKQSPTFREIADGINLISTSNIDRYIFVLKNKNFIDYLPYSHRSITVLKEPL